MIINRGAFAWRAGVTVAAGLILATSVPGAAHAASKFANKDGFDRSGGCDAILGVSDETTPGKVEVFGGFSCPTDSGLWNMPEVTTIRLRIFQDGQEVIQSKKALKSCKTVKGTKWTCATDSFELTFPDYSSSDSFYGKMEISSFGGSVTLTTGAITT
jgi:hypothetical protein